MSSAEKAGGEGGGVWVSKARGKERVVEREWGDVAEKYKLMVGRRGEIVCVQVYIARRKKKEL